jgi:16S rRNA (guanine527-N7)-methyltransferase
LSARLTPDEERTLRAGAGAFGVDLVGEALERIARFLEVLTLWNRGTRLTGERDTHEIVRKHVVDSLAPARHLPPRGLIVDVGAGAGFPGVVLAALRPEQPAVLIEARRRRASFLGEVIRTIPLPRARVVEGRAEDVGREPGIANSGAFVIARAIRLDTFLPLAASLLGAEGLAIAMQTPHVAPASADRLARCSRLEVIGHDDYVLPAGERRRLLLFRRR